MTFLAEPFTHGPGAWMPGLGGSMAGSNFALSDTARKLAAVYTAERDGSLSQVFVNVVSKTGTADASVRYWLGIYTLLTDGSGAPDTSSPFGGMTAANPTQASFPSSGIYTLTLPVAAAVQAGQDFAVVLWHDAGSTAPTSSFVTARSRYQGSVLQVPYEIEFITSWTKNSTLPGLGAIYSTGEYVGLPQASLATANFNSASAPNEHAALFTLDRPMRCTGMGFWNKPTVAGTGRITLYDASDAILRSKSLAAGVATSASSYGEHPVSWDPIDLAAETPYRLGSLATSTDNRQHLEYGFASSAIAANVVPQAARWQRSSRTNSADTGAWSNDNTKVPLMFLICSGHDLTVTGGGGGGGGQRVWGE